MTKIIIISAAIILTFITGLFIGTKSQAKTDNRGEAVRENDIVKSQYQFINPLLECETSSSENFSELISFRSELNELISKELISKEINHISVYFRDLNNGPWIGINEKEYFSPASLLKVPLMAAILKKSETNPEFLQTKVRFTGKIEEINSQIIKPSITIMPNTEYSVEQLVNLMIQYSDNNSTRLLSELLSKDEFFSPYKDLGIETPTQPNGQYQIRIKDYASFFRVFFNSSYLSRQYSEKALQILSKSEYTQGLTAKLPAEIQVSHKFGERAWGDSNEKQLHDCGIIYYPNKPYLLCIMTRGTSFDRLSQTISNISKLTYDEVAKQLTPTKAQ